MVRLDWLLAAALAASTCCEARRIDRAGGARRSSAATELVSTRDDARQHVSRDKPAAPAPSDSNIMRPVRIPRSGNAKRDRRTALELKSSDTLYWSAVDGTMAKFTIELPDEMENIVNLEQFDGMVREITCPPEAGEFKIAFNEKADFDDAADIWRWVNEKADNHFYLVVGAGDCGFNKDRIVYNVTNLVYNDEAETAVLEAKLTTWKEAAHTFDLTVGRAALPPPSSSSTSAHHRRDIGDFFDNVGDKFKDVGDKIVDGVEKIGDKIGDALTIDERPSFSVPLSADLTGSSLSFDLPGNKSMTASVTCVECSTAGSLQVEGHFAARAFDITAASVRVSLPDEGLRATTLLELALTAELRQGVKRSVPIFKAAPSPLIIPQLMTIGPAVALNLVGEIGAVQGTVALTMGGRATVAGGSWAMLDFFDEKKTSKEGWGVTFEGEQFAAKASIETTAGVFLRGSIGLEISVLESGFSAEVQAEAPSFTATLKATASTDCSVCGDFQTGIEGSLNLGASLGAALTTKILGLEIEPWSTEFFKTELTLAEFCQGLGPQGDACLNPFD